MSLLDDLAAAPDNARRSPRAHPDGWEPGVEWNGRTGEITAQWDHKVPDWRALLAMWDFDPDQYEVVEPVQVRTWDATIGDGEVRRMWYHRAGIRLRRAAGPDIQHLVALVSKAKPRKVGNGLTESKIDGSAYFLTLNDLQIGKRGTAKAIQRIADAIDASAVRARKRKPGSVWLPALGDLGEACDGMYPSQTYEVEHNRRDQGILVRRILLHAIDTHRGIAPIVMPVLPGNHGEHRKDGRAFTSPGDNDDIAWPEQVAEACSTNPAVYGHVKFLIPRDDLTMTVQPVSDGPIVGLAHGHQFPKGLAAKSMQDWWEGQMFGMQPVSDATILVSAHRHHFQILENGPRTWIQAPTMDSGSPHFAERFGTDSKPGMLSFVVTAKGWDELKLL